MKRAWIVGLAMIAAWGWAAGRSDAAWSDDLDRALSGGTPVVVLVADPARPLSAATQASLDRAWSALRPRARRVQLETCPPECGDASALAVCVFAPGGERVARHDGWLEAGEAQDWLRAALAAAEDSLTQARATPAALLEHAIRALQLGEIRGAEEEFKSLCSSAAPDLRGQAHAWLARLEIERGNLVAAREQWTLAGAAPPPGGTSAQRLLTRGLIEFAARDVRAACASFSEASRALADCDAPAADRARLEGARAQAACGEESAAIATLEPLSRTGNSRAIRNSARQLIDDLRLPPATH